MLTLNYTYRLYPDTIQELLLQEWLETCRQVYNYSLRELKDWLASRKSLSDRCSLEKEYIIPADAPFPGYQAQQDALPSSKKNFPRLAEVPSQVLQTTVRRLHDTWESFQKRGFGFPRFKKFGQFKSLLFPQFKENPVTGIHTAVATTRGTRATRCLIKLSKLGLVPINLHRPILEGFVVKQVRIIKKADRWYASINIQCDVNVPNPMPHGHPIGVDTGLEKFLATSDGVLVKPPKFFKNLLIELKLLQRRLSRKQKRSKNYEKQRLKVARMHHKIDNTRKDFHFKQAHALCDVADMVFMEDLDYRVSAKGMLGKHMLDAGFGQFRDLVKYVSWKRDKFFAVVDARGTSQECPECGAEVRKDLSVRIHCCPNCNYTTDRDVASGQVIRNRGISLISTPGHGGMETVCAVDLPGAGAIPSRQEAKPRKGTTRKSKK